LSDRARIAKETERERGKRETEAKQMPVALLIKQQFEKQVYRNIPVKI
jgi:hypothetical protein